MKTLVLLAFGMFGGLFPGSLHAAAPSDSEIKTKVLGLWRSPRHEYEFKANGKVYMLPISPDTTKGEWSVRGGKFVWDGESYLIVTLTDKRFVYKSLSIKEGNEGFVLNRITAKMVGQPYNRESVK